MRIDLKQNAQELFFTIAFDAFDSVQGPGQRHEIQLNENTFRFSLPFDDEIHPDLLAAAVLSVVLPFAGDRIQMPRAVSAHFADAVHHAFNKELTPVDSQLQARTPGTRPGLAMSGGVDSLAAMLLMPEESALVFFERVEHPETEIPDHLKTYDVTKPLSVCDFLESKGKSVYRVQSDHEYIIRPVPDWSTWMGVGSPLILMADHLALDSIWFGSVLGSIYIPDWNGYEYFSWDNLREPWQQVLTAVGIPIARPVAGISEIGTARIVDASPYAQVKTSCANGPDGRPCMTCPKCLRKLLIHATQHEYVPDRAILRHFARQPEIQRSFSEDLLDHIFLYCFTRLPTLPNMYFQRVQRAFQAIPTDVSFLERWFSRSIEHIPNKYRAEFVERKNRYLQDCTEEDIKQIENYRSPHLTIPEPGLLEFGLTRGRRIAAGAYREVSRLVNRQYSRVIRDSQMERVE